VSETEATQRNSPDAGASDETVSKVYVKDLKIGEALSTVFKVTEKSRLASRSGKPYLSLVLVDKTGSIDGRIFDNVTEADAAFAANDYLLVRGTVGHFHGKPQLVVERLERLDPGPIDAAEYAYTAPPPEARKEKEPREAREPRDEGTSHKAARQRLLKLLDDPQITMALDALVRRFEKLIDERLDARLGHGSNKSPGAPKVEKKRGGRGENRPEAKEAKDEKKEQPAAEAKKPQRDPGLPEGLTFKPLDALVGENSTPGANEG